MGSSIRKIAAAGLMAASLALGGCLYDDYGYGGGGVGYGIAGGYGGGYYGDGYGYGGYGGGYGSGWYDDFYYPGTGYYVYDRGGRRSRWNDGQRRYWEQRRTYRGDGRHDGRNYGRDRRDWRQPGQPGQPVPGARPDRGRPDGDRGWQGRRNDRPDYRRDGPRPSDGGIRQGGGRRGGDGIVGRVRDRVNRGR